MLYEQEIKQALKKAGLAEELFDQITVKTVDEIAGAVTQLKTDMDSLKNLTQDKFLAAVKNAGLEDSLTRYIQSETDRRITQYTKTQEEKLKKTADEDKKKKDDELKTKDLTPEQKEMATLRDEVKTLKELIQNFSTVTTSERITAAVKQELKTAGLTEDFASYIKVDNLEGVKAAVKDFGDKILTREQSVIDKKIESGDLSPVKKGLAGMTVGESAIIDFAKSETATANTGGLAAEQVNSQKK